MSRRGIDFHLLETSIINNVYSNDTCVASTLLYFKFKHKALSHLAGLFVLHKVVKQVSPATTLNLRS
jgi:hypothetical protein